MMHINKPKPLGHIGITERERAEIRDKVLEVIRRDRFRIYLEDAYYDMLIPMVNATLQQENIEAHINFDQNGDLHIFPFALDQEQSRNAKRTEGGEEG